ncbi:putative serine carboxypeptidase-like 23 [Phalaenopsis equestris]|uniref:putative serine carboxypeptidase-like 23 n=1 Tax=Phalaenopsis equestris TaxID=78828 RepID=UPI0009E55852|nr:putative serine carboxypeptidase-like 23 [Phalaenopsis equestris]
MKILLPLLFLLLSPSSATTGRLILDFIYPKIISGTAGPWNLTFLPDIPISSKSGSKDSDLISALPGQPKGIVLRQYSGYIPVDDKSGRFIFYYFAVSKQTVNVTEIPIFVWINGGPGCSSIGAGAFLEHGPLLVAPGGKALMESSYAWNKFAHVLYVDVPVGTGFSYSDTPSDYHNYNDATVAADSLRFLVNWLARFPEYAGQKIYLAGEGYAGNYIPQLAQLIHNRKRSGKYPSINLKGIILQNAVLDAEEDRWGFFDHLWSHGMLSQRLYDDIEKHCIKNSTSKGCIAATQTAGRVIAPLYMFDLRAELCCSTEITTPRLPVDEYYECREKDVAAYLGLPEVQRALHVNPAKAPKKWIQCNSDVAKSYGEITNSTLPILKNLLTHNISALVYNGDADMVIPPMSSRLSTKKLNFTKKTYWHGWYPSKIDVGGYSEGYPVGLDYATVRGAGHFVAKTKGQQLQFLLEAHLDGTLANITIPAAVAV